jgi:penicillin amidase
MLRALALLVSIAAGACSADDASRPLAPIDLAVDTLGITHVYAASERDAFFGAGYAMARDRLFQMEINRRQALGTQAEVLGDAALADDQRARLLGFGRLGAADVARVRAERPSEMALFEAWVGGVNRRVDEVRRGLVPRPYGFRPSELDFLPAPWRVEDAFAVGKALSFALSNTLDQEILATVIRNVFPDLAAKLPVLMPAYDFYIVGDANGGAGGPQPLAHHFGREAAPLVVRRPFAAAPGSNNWAVDGAHSTNGRPFVCGDPHQALTSPGRLWPTHMSGGTLDVIGFSYPGTPTVQLGHNAHVGWTATTNFADAMDLWDVDVGGLPRVAHLGDGDHRVVARQETIRVRDAGAAAGVGHDEALTVEEVVGYGILLPDDFLPVPLAFVANGTLLFNWTGFQPSMESSAYLAMDRAEDRDAFDRAADLLDVGAVNFVAADARGIDYRAHARVPDRGDPASHPMPWHVLDGMDGASLWKRGNLPQDKLPHLRDPPRGFLLSANNDPFGFTADGSVENDPWYYGAFYANGFRAARITGELARLTDGGGRVSRGDMEALQDDVHSELADTLLPLLGAAIAKLGSDPALRPWAGRADLRALAGELAAWDRNLTVSSRAAAIFVGLEWFTVERAFSARLPPSLFDEVSAKSPPYLVGALRNVLVGRVGDVGYFAPDGIDALVVGGLDATASWLKARFGDGPVRLGDLQAARFGAIWGGEGGALDSGRLPAAGGVDTVFVNEAAFFDGGAPRAALTASEMSLYRMVIGFGDDGTPEATLDFSRGTSGEPGDPHFADQQAAWRAGAHAPLPFRRADVDAATESRSTLR